MDENDDLIIVFVLLPIIVVKPFIMVLFTKFMTHKEQFSGLVTLAWMQLFAARDCWIHWFCTFVSCALAPKASTARTKPQRIM